MVLDRTIQPSIRQMESFQIQKPKIHIMPNGIPVKILKAGEEEVVRLDIMMRGGQWEQEQPLQAMLTARMLREGSSQYSSSEIAEKLDYYGAWLDVSSSMNYSFVTLYSLNKYFAQTLSVVVSLLREPLFPEKEFSIVLGSNRQQFMINQEKVDVLARKELNQILFGKNHPCGRYASVEDYEKLSVEDLHRLYNKYYHSKNCTCYVSGYVTENVLAIIEEMLGKDVWGNGCVLRELTDIQPANRTIKAKFIERNDSCQSAIYLGNFTVDCHHADFFKTRLLITLFGGYFGSRLMKNIREDKGYTYGVNAGMLFYPFRNMMVINTQAANEYVRPIIKEIEHEIDRLQNETVTEKELTMVKNYTMGDMCRNYESPFSLSDAYIFLETAGLQDDFFLLSQQAVFDLTRNDIRELACRYLHKENLIEVVAGKKM